MRTYQASGIVLHRTLLGDYDKILTLYTREHGKLSAVAKGARRGGSKISGATELFTNTRFLISKGRNLDVISQCEIAESFPLLRNDLEKLTRATYICELLDRLTLDRDEAACAELYDMISGALLLLQRAGEYLDGVVHAYELHLLAEIGYAPVLQSCSRCGNVIEKTPAFSPSSGGMLCSDHRHLARDASVFSREAMWALVALGDADPEALLKIEPSTRVRTEIARALRGYISHRIDRNLKSADFLDQLRHTSQIENLEDTANT